MGLAWWVGLVGGWFLPGLIGLNAVAISLGSMAAGFHDKLTKAESKQAHLLPNDQYRYSRYVSHQGSTYRLG